MRRRRTTWTILLTLGICGQGLGGEGTENHGPSRRHLFQRVHPAGGWNPYGGGIFHWWDPHCFPCQNAPDNYCRKPLPSVCWPPYPPYYTWGTGMGDSRIPH